MRYLTADQVLFLHARVIDETGGAHGVRDVGLLQAAVARPQATYGGHDLYPDLFTKAAAMMESLARNHPFLDGNKRTAITSTGVFLSMNGFHLKADPRDLVRFSLNVAVGKMSDRDAADWLKKNSFPEKK